MFKILRSFLLLWTPLFSNIAFKEQATFLLRIYVLTCTKALLKIFLIFQMLIVFYHLYTPYLDSKRVTIWSAHLMPWENLALEMGLVLRAMQLTEWIGMEGAVRMCPLKTFQNINLGYLRGKLCIRSRNKIRNQSYWVIKGKNLAEGRWLVD